MNLYRVLQSKKLESYFNFHLHVSSEFRFCFLLFWIMYSCWQHSRSLIRTTKVWICSCLHLPTLKHDQGKSRDQVTGRDGDQNWSGWSSQEDLETMNYNSSTFTLAHYLIAIPNPKIPKSLERAPFFQRRDLEKECLELVWTCTLFDLYLKTCNVCLYLLIWFYLSTYLNMYLKITCFKIVYLGIFAYCIIHLFTMYNEWFLAYSEFQ